MAMTYNEDQSMLRDSARDFMKTEAPVAHLRKYRDMDCKDGFSHDLWKQFADKLLSRTSSRLRILASGYCCSARLCSMNFRNSGPSE